MDLPVPDAEAERIELGNKRVVECGVVPDVLDKLDGKCSLRLEFDSGVEANWGNTLTPTQTRHPPKAVFSPLDEDAFYSLIKQDPDAPSKADPSASEWHHWWVGNIPGGKVHDGEVLSEYIGDGPPPDTGLHRYVYIVLKQKRREVFADEPRLSNKSMEGRSNTSLREIIRKYDMTPVACNFYEAEFDDYVPMLYKQLKGEE